MANNSNINVSINGSINGDNINQSQANSTTPSGSTLINVSIPVTTGTWQQVFTGSLTVPIGSITVFNTATNSSSIILALSASGIVNNLGNISASGASTVQWNNVVTALYAQALVSSSFGVFYAVAQ